MKAIGYFTLLFLTMSLISCSSSYIGSSDGGAAAVSAPSVLSGKTYRLTVESVSGAFDKTGTYTVVFSSSQPTYTTQGDGVNFGDSGGMYIYSSSGDSGTIKIFDSVTSKVAYSFTFNTAISGTYVATAMADVNSRHSGTFTEQ
jgi:hypothetical protein